MIYIKIILDNLGIISKKEIMLNITIFYKFYGRKSGQCKPPANFYLVGLLPFTAKN